MASRRSLIAAALLASGALACPAPRHVQGHVFGQNAVGSNGTRVLTMPVRGATATWTCPSSEVGAPAPQTMTTDNEGHFGSKELYANVPGSCDLVVTSPGYADFRAPFSVLCQDVSSDGSCRSVNVAVQLIAIAPLDAAASAIPLDAPRGATQTVFSVVLTADGKTQVDGKPVADDEAILPLATAAHEKNPEMRAVIKADSSCSHGRVIHVLDLLKQAKVSKIAFGVTPIGGNASP